MYRMMCLVSDASIDACIDEAFMCVRETICEFVSICEIVRHVCIVLLLA